jgi:hypothetical protein
VTNLIFFQSLKCAAHKQKQHGGESVRKEIFSNLEGLTLDIEEDVSKTTFR